ncbi:MAG: hypothetical protein NTV17_06170, partial [Burkholderiales bacterium]|nr:hypothetical protein [Burkholderiales bacterium]
LMNKKEHMHVLKMKPEDRWQYVYATACKVKRCGEKTDNDFDGAVWIALSPCGQCAQASTGHDP